jgi:hypothetical protein
MTEFYAKSLKNGADSGNRTPDLLITNQRGFAPLPVSQNRILYFCMDITAIYLYLAEVLKTRKTALSF